MGRISAVYADQRALPQIIEKPAEFFPAGLFADVIVTAHGLHQVAEPRMLVQQLPRVASGVL